MIDLTTSPIAHVYELLNDGSIKSIRVAAARLVSLQSIENYLKRLAHEQAHQSSLPGDVQLAAALQAQGSTAKFYEDD